MGQAMSPPSEGVKCFLPNIQAQGLHSFFGGRTIVFAWVDNSNALMALGD